MLLTEEEAKRQRCIGPVGCGKETGTGAFMPLVDSHESYERRCVASGCKMAWRWADPDFMQYEMPGGDVEAEALGGRRRGYCGIAGKPQEHD